MTNYACWTQNCIISKRRRHPPIDGASPILLPHASHLCLYIRAMRYISMCVCLYAHSVSFCLVLFHRNFEISFSPRLSLAPLYFPQTRMRTRKGGGGKALGERNEEVRQHHAIALNKHVLRVCALYAHAFIQKWAEENAKEGLANLALDCVAIHSNSIHGLRL